jgi:rhodanese-related sulfurtransferase
MMVTQIGAIDAFELLKKDQNSLLVDVRTNEEFSFVGVVNAETFANRMALIPWQVYPSMEENPEFSDMLENSLKQFFKGDITDIKIIFLCRTGGRSYLAANYAINLGYKNCYNLTSGFEGDFNDAQQRGKVNGWKAQNLPWRQK